MTVTAVRRRSREEADQAVAWRGVLSLSGLFSFVYCLTASNHLVESPLYGGALYLLAQVTVRFILSCTGAQWRRHTAPVRRGLTALMALVFLCALTLLVVLPGRLSSGQIWMIFCLVLALTARDVLCGHLLRLDARGVLRRGWFALWLAVLHLLPALAMMWVYLVHLPAPAAWQYLAGWGLCDLVALYDQLMARSGLDALPAGEAEGPAEPSFAQTLRGGNAYRIWEALSSVFVVAVNVTTALAFSFLALSAQELALALLITAAVAVGSWQLAGFLLRLRGRRLGGHPDPTNVMLVGFFLWIFGLRSLRITVAEGGGMGSVYMSLALLCAGYALCFTALRWLETAMRAVTKYALGREPASYTAFRAASLQMAELIGQTLTLALITLYVFLSREAVFRLYMFLPASLLTLAALVFALRFPLSSRYLRKLSRFLGMEEPTREEALRRQLDGVVLEKRLQPFGTSFLRALIRRIYPHRLLGKEHIHLDDGNPIVFLCNHGEIYGPLVAISWMPVPVRPWVIARIAVDREQVTDYLYRYTFKDLAWMPRPLRRPVAWLAGRFLSACMRQLESIPVYRDSPGQLMKTFRASVEAMQAGDNLLIFPENPNAVAQDHGYEREGVGELFAGFAMLGQIYYARTGKRCRFVPMFCHKDAHTIRFAPEIVYDPEADPETERRRVAETCEAEMRRMWAEENERLAREARGARRDISTKSKKERG